MNSKSILCKKALPKRYYSFFVGLSGNYTNTESIYLSPYSITDANVVVVLNTGEHRVRKPSYPSNSEFVFGALHPTLAEIWPNGVDLEKPYVVFQQDKEYPVYISLAGNPESKSATCKIIANSISFTHSSAKVLKELLSNIAFNTKVSIAFRVDLEEGGGYKYLICTLQEKRNA